MNPNIGTYSYGDPRVQTSIVGGSPQPQPKTNRSFVDNKPMIQGLVRSVLKVEKNGDAHLINTGLTDNEGARQIAKNIFSYYDSDGTGTIDTVKVQILTSRPCRC